LGCCRGRADGRSRLRIEAPASKADERDLASRKGIVQCFGFYRARPACPIDVGFRPGLRQEASLSLVEVLIESRVTTMTGCIDRA
jgi:hypothetical protein